MRTLGSVCVEIALQEYNRVNPPTAKDVAKYLSVCERNGVKLGITKGNHCAGFASWCAVQAAHELGVPMPHKPRAGAKELMADAIESHTWHKKSEVLEGVWTPSGGDLAIYDRSVPGRPETAWWGHVDRVVSVQGDRYENIGANEVWTPSGINATNIQWTPYNHSRLLGFIGYPSSTQNGPVHLLEDWEIEYVKGLVALTAAQSRSGSFDPEGDYDPDWKSKTA